MPPQPPPAIEQLDLFEHSAALMVFNDLADALARDDLQAAPGALARLAAEHPGHAHQGAAQRLIGWLAAERQAPSDDEPEAVLRARAELSGPVTTAAHDVLGGAEAAPWLARRWLALARRAHALHFRREMPDAHAAALYLAGGHWAQAAEAAQRIESWRRIPVVLAWVVQADALHRGMDAVWPLLAELCWLAPARALALLRTLPDRRMPRWLQGFEAALDVDMDGTPQAIAWLPAWLLVEQPLLLEPLSLAQPTGDSEAERGLRLVATLLRLEREGRHAERTQRRRELQQLQPQLFAAYMKTR